MCACEKDLRVGNQTERGRGRGERTLRITSQKRRIITINACENIENSFFFLIFFQNGEFSSNFQSARHALDQFRIRVSAKKKPKLDTETNAFDRYVMKCLNHRIFVGSYTPETVIIQKFGIMSETLCRERVSC